MPKSSELPEATPVPHKEYINEALKTLASVDNKSEIFGASLHKFGNGCARRKRLVIHGRQKGFIWNDDRADNSGLSLLLSDKGAQMTFADSYLD